MARRVWVIERDGQPVASGIGEPVPTPTAGHTLTWYVDAGALKALAVLLEATAGAARASAYSDGTREGLRAVFAGRSDGFAVASDWLTALLLELESGEPGPITGQLLPAETPPAELP